MAAVSVLRGNNSVLLSGDNFDDPRELLYKIKFKKAPKLGPSFGSKPGGGLTTANTAPQFLPKQLLRKCVMLHLSLKPSGKEERRRSAPPR